MVDLSTIAKILNVVAILPCQHAKIEKIERMLDAFERQLAKFERGGSPDYELMERAVSLCVECLDPHRGAAERLLLAVQPDQNVVPGISTTTIDEEYKHVVEEAHQVAMAIEAVFREVELRREIFGQIGHAFIDVCRQQMRVEEQTYLPAITENLRMTDRLSISPAISITAECALDERCGSSNQTQYQKIVGWDEAEFSGRP